MVVLPARTAGCATEPAEERQVRRQAFDLGLGQRVAQTQQRLVARRAVGDELGDHRVVGDPDLVALLDSRVDSDSARQAQALDRARPGEKRERILRVEANLDCVAVEPWLDVEPLPGGDADLLADEVDAGHELGDRMLDLDLRPFSSRR